jgi:hypothetical protein
MLPLVHHGDAVGDRHRLGLVVGDVHGRDAHLALQVLEEGARLEAQLGVEVAERLVEQEHLRLVHHRARHRGALLLAARDLPGRRASRLPICRCSATSRARGAVARGTPRTLSG